MVAAQRSRVVRSIPNTLTILRLVAVPVLIAVMVAERGASLAAGLIFLAASFTDFFDGFLARRLRVMSQFGKVVDPIADRLLVNSAVVLLCVFDSRWVSGSGRLLGPEFLVVVARDAAALYGYSRIRHHVLPDVTRLGKWGMASMMAGLTWLLLLPSATWPTWPFEAGLMLSVVVMVHYFRRFVWTSTALPRHQP